MVFNLGEIIIFPIFHLAVPLIIFEIPQIKKKVQFNRFALLIGAIIPDIIDKTLMFLNISSGRGYSHTLLFALISSSLILLLTKGNKAITMSYFIGTLFHLLLDLPEIPLFFPLVPYDFIYIEDPFGQWLFTLLNEPLIYVTEIIGIVILVFIVVNNKLYNINKIRNYFLKTSNVEFIIQ